MPFSRFLTTLIRGECILGIFRRMTRFPVKVGGRSSDQERSHWLVTTSLVHGAPRQKTPAATSSARPPRTPATGLTGQGRRAATPGSARSAPPRQLEGGIQVGRVTRAMARAASATTPSRGVRQPPATPRQPSPATPTSCHANGDNLVKSGGCTDIAIFDIRRIATAKVTEYRGVVHQAISKHNLLTLLSLYGTVRYVLRMYCTQDVRRLESSTSPL